MKQTKFIDRAWNPLKPGDCVWYENNPWEFVAAEEVDRGRPDEGPVLVWLISARNMDTNEYHDVEWPTKTSVHGVVQFYTVALNPCENCKNQLRCMLRGEPRLLESGTGLEGLDLAT